MTTVPLGHALLFAVAFFVGLLSDHKRTRRVLAAMMFVLWGLICLAWQAGNNYPGLSPAFVDLFGQLFIFCLLLGLVVGKGGLEIIKLIPKKTPP